MSVKNPSAVELLYGYVVNTAPAETLAFMTLAGAVDAGEAAGTVVYGKLANAPVLNLLGDRIGEYNGDSNLAKSIVFTTGVMDSTKEVGFVFHGDLDERLSRTAAKLTTNGQWACDYLTGLIIVKKAAATATQSITSYKYRTIKVDTSDTAGGAAGGSAGGGNNTYSTEQGDFTATPTDATFNIVLSVDSLGGQAITAANFANGILKIMDVSLTPDEFRTVTLDKFTWTAATKTLDITNCTGAFMLGTGDVVSLMLTGPDKMRDSSNDAQRASLIRDTSDQHLGQTLVDTTNITGAPTTYYYPSSSGLSMAGYRNLSIQGMISGGITATVEMTNDDATSPDWLDITPAGYNPITNAYGAASFVDTNFILDFDNLNAKNVRIKIVAADSTNAVQLNTRLTF